MVEKARLPPIATIEPQEAMHIASSLDRIKETFDYWKKQFQNKELFGHDKVDIFEDSDTPAMLFGKQMQNGRMVDLFPKRKHLTRPTDEEQPSCSTPDKKAHMVSVSGCLVSAQEIAQGIASDGTVESIFRDLDSLKAAASAKELPEDKQQVARGIRATRELFDASRRFKYITTSSVELNLDFVELFALYRQEAALCVTPPQDSFLCGPLINTAEDCTHYQCRRSHVIFRGDRTLERPGFNLVYKFNQNTPADGARDESCRLDMLVRNLLVIGGLDVIVSADFWLPQKDELRQVFKQAWNKGSPLSKALQNFKSSLYNKVAPSQRRFLLELAMGRLMLDIDDMDQIDDLENMLDGMVRELNELFVSHNHYPSSPHTDKDIFLLGDRIGADTSSCLKVQAKWYHTRTKPYTLLAWANRSTANVKQLPRFSTFLSYMRFNGGDPVFMGVLLRSITKLDKLDAKWKDKQATFGTRFRDEFSKANRSKTKPSNLQRDLDKFWKTGKVRTGTAWRHVGLIQALKDSGNYPRWLKDPQPDANLSKTAEIAWRVMSAIADQRLLDCLSAGLEFTPIDTLKDLNMIPTASTIEDPRAILVNAHSFERLRLAYEQAAQKGRSSQGP